METVLNNRLPWNGSHLGSYTSIIITNNWIFEGMQYHTLRLYADDNIPMDGVLHCNIKATKDYFPCIVDEIKSIFNLPKRGFHRMMINNVEYIVYYIPVTITGEIISETTLNRLDKKHMLRKNPEFMRQVQELIIFRDILALTHTGEHSICLKTGVGGASIPISINEMSTSLVKGCSYDFSILSKTMFTTWFGEHTSMSDITKHMVGYDHTSNLCILLFNIRNSIEIIINKYNPQYIWYANFIMDRLRRQLL